MFSRFSKRASEPPNSPSPSLQASRPSCPTASAFSNLDSRPPTAKRSGFTAFVQKVSRAAELILKEQERQQAKSALWAEFDAKDELNAKATEQELEKLREKWKSRSQATGAKITAISSQQPFSENPVTKAIDALEEAEYALHQYQAGYPSDKNTGRTPLRLRSQSGATFENGQGLDHNKKGRNRDWIDGNQDRDANPGAAWVGGRQKSSQYKDDESQPSISHTERADHTRYLSQYSILAARKTGDTQAVNPSWRF